MRTCSTLLAPTGLDEIVEFVAEKCMLLQIPATQGKREDPCVAQALGNSVARYDEIL